MKLQQLQSPIIYLLEAKRESKQEKGEVARAIDKVKEATDKSQNELAKDLGVSKGAISLWRKKGKEGRTPLIKHLAGLRKKGIKVNPEHFT